MIELFRTAFLPPVEFSMLCEPLPGESLPGVTLPPETPGRLTWSICFLSAAKACSSLSFVFGCVAASACADGYSDWVWSSSSSARTAACLFLVSYQEYLCSAIAQHSPSYWLAVVVMIAFGLLLHCNEIVHVPVNTQSIHSLCFWSLLLILVLDPFSWSFFFILALYLCSSLILIFVLDLFPDPGSWSFFLTFSPESWS